MLSFDVTRADNEVIRRIARRAVAMYRDHGIRADQLSIAMDVTATHANGTPLDLRALLGAKDHDFAHDIGGMNRHLDRQTGKLRDQFRPRFASWDKPAEVAA